MLCLSSSTIKLLIFFISKKNHTRLISWSMCKLINYSKRIVWRHEQGNRDLYFLPQCSVTVKPLVTPACSAFNGALIAGYERHLFCLSVLHYLCQLLVLHLWVALFMCMCVLTPGWLLCESAHLNSWSIEIFCNKVLNRLLCLYSCGLPFISTSEWQCPLMKHYTNKI